MPKPSGPPSATIAEDCGLSPARRLATCVDACVARSAWLAARVLPVSPLDGGPGSHPESSPMEARYHVDVVLDLPPERASLEVLADAIDQRLAACWQGAPLDDTPQLDRTAPLQWLRKLETLQRREASFATASYTMDDLLTRERVSQQVHFAPMTLGWLQLEWRYCKPRFLWLSFSCQHLPPKLNCNDALRYDARDLCSHVLEPDVRPRPNRNLVPWHLERLVHLIRGVCESARVISCQPDDTLAAFLPRRGPCPWDSLGMLDLESQELTA